MELLDVKIEEAMEFKILNKQNAQGRLRAISAQVKAARDEELGNFMSHKIVQFLSQLNTEQAKGEASQRAMPSHENRIIHETIEDRKVQLSMLNIEADVRRIARLRIEEDGAQR